MKNLVSFFTNLFSSNRVKDLEEKTQQMSKDIEELKVLAGAQSKVIISLVSAYREVYEAMAFGNVIRTNQKISYSEADVDQIYENFIANPPNDDDLLN
tara:strand:+ start:467 stop:760 length:294 start_codon:yes stop_codon:yes gene_type:complete